MATGGDDRDRVTEDWFEDVGEPRGFRDPEAETWLEEPEEGGGPPDRRPLILALAVAVVLVLLGFGLVRLLTGGDDDEGAAVTVTTTAPATTAATETAGTQETDTGTTPAVTSTVPEDVTLKSGDSGDEVQQLQEALAALGYDIGEPDGSFGPTTEAAVMQFQADAGLTADCVAGPETLAAINDALAATG